MILRHVLFAIPSQLDGFTLHCFRQVHRLQDVVGFGTSTESAAHELRVHENLADVQACQGCSLVAGDRWRLGTGPNIQPIFLQPGHCIHRLHRGMRQEGDPVLRLQHLRCGQGIGHIAVVANAAVLVLVDKGRIYRFHEHSGRCAMNRPGPVALNRLRSLEGTPCVVCNHAHTTRQRHHLKNTLHRLGGCRLKALDGCTNGWVHAHSGKHHSRESYVNTEGGRASALAHHIDPWHVLAQVAPLLAWLEWRVVGQLHLGSSKGQLGVG